MKKCMRALLAALIIVCIFTLTACGSEIDGTWISATSESRTALTFKSNGSVTLEQDGYIVKGEFTAKDGKLTMRLIDQQGDAYVINAEYALSGKKLFIENENGQVEAFTK